MSNYFIIINLKLLNHEHFIREVSTCAVVVNRVGTIASKCSLTIIVLLSLSFMSGWKEKDILLAVMSK